MNQRPYRHPAVMAGRVGLTSIVGLAALLAVVGLPAPPADTLGEPAPAVLPQIAPADAPDGWAAPAEAWSYEDELADAAPRGRRRCGPMTGLEGDDGVRVILRRCGPAVVVDADGNELAVR